MTVGSILSDVSVRQKHARCLAKVPDISWEKVRARTKFILIAFLSFLLN